MSTLSLLTVALLGAATSEDAIRVVPGTQQVLKVPGLTRVAIAAPDVADVNVVGGDLLILGKRKGRTTITLWAGGRKPVTRPLVVDDNKTAELARLVKEQVNPGLKVETYNEKIVIEGELDSPDELSRLRTLVSDEPNVKLLVRINPRVLTAIAEQINTAFHKASLHSARAVVIGQKLLLEGSVADADEMKRAVTIAESYYSGIQFTP